MLLTNRQKLVPRFGLNILRKGIKYAINYAKYDWRVLYNVNINYAPPILVVNIVNTCNLRCPTCLYLVQDKNIFDKKKREISPLNFYDTLKKINAEKAEMVWLDGGEPLLHSQFKTLIQISKLFKLKVKISTNGILISNKLPDILELDSINISLDAWDSDSFKENRGGTSKQWEKIIDGLKCLRFMGKPFSISFLLTMNNIKDISKMIELADQVQPETVHFHNYNPHKIDGQLVLIAYKDLTYLYNLKNRNDYNYDIVVAKIFDFGEEEFYASQCIQPWYYYCVDLDGNRSPCCHLKHDSEWHYFDRLEQFRKRIIENNLTNLPKDCYYCQRRFIGNNSMAFNFKKQKWS